MSQTRRNILAGVMFAMQPDMLDTVADIVERHLRSERAPAAQQGEATEGADAGPHNAVAGRAPGKGYAITADGVAVIQLGGMMARNPGLIAKACMGVTSCLTVARVVEQAVEDPDVRAMVLDIDSPGGTVNGTTELAQAIRRADAVKPVVAYSGGLMCSAAYWVGSAASKVVVVDTATVGSIGVATVHCDRSAEDAQKGVTRSVIYAGAYKRIASDERPLTEEGRAYLQSQVDRLYASFVEAVAEHRGVDAEAVVQNMADGRVFIGRQALTAGLVDAIGDIETALTLAGELADNPHPEQEATMRDSKGAQAAGKGQQQDASLSTEPGVVLAESVEAAANAARDAERARVIEILEAGGPADVTLDAVKQGTPAAEVYKLVLAAERTQRTTAISVLADSLAPSAGAEGQQKGGDKAAGDFMGEVRRYAAANNVTQSEAVRAVAASNPDLHAAFLGGQK